MPFLQPQKITLLSTDSVRAEFVIDGTSAESAALFLPTYTYVSTNFLSGRRSKAGQPAVAVGRSPRSLRSLSRPPLNGSIVGQTKW